MQYLKTKNAYILRLEQNEELITTLKDFVIDNKIKSAFFYGLGTIKELILGYYDTKQKIYHKRTFVEEYEISSLIGNISYLSTDPIIHIHLTIAADNFIAYAGHLFQGLVGATCEIILFPLAIKLPRKADPKLGLNLLDLSAE